MRVEEGGSGKFAFRPVGLKQEFLCFVIGVFALQSFADACSMTCM